MGERWTCQGCGCQFPKIEHDDDVKFCTQCVTVKQQALRIRDLEAERDEVKRERDKLEQMLNEKFEAIDTFTTLRLKSQRDEAMAVIEEALGFYQVTHIHAGLRKFLTKYKENTG